MSVVSFLLIEGTGFRECFAAAFTIGRRPSDDGVSALILLDDEYVSPLHAACYPSGDGWAIEDLGSMNGTWLNGVKVYGAQLLARGDKVKVGHTVLTAVPG
jgi:pSer/pThr/pTyr-binding forkhead associated (FHA) protein